MLTEAHSRPLCLASYRAAACGAPASAAGSQRSLVGGCMVSLPAWHAVRAQIAQETPTFIYADGRDMTGFTDGASVPDVPPACLESLRFVSALCRARLCAASFSRARAERLAAARLSAVTRCACVCDCALHSCVVFAAVARPRGRDHSGWQGWRGWLVRDRTALGQSIRPRSRQHDAMQYRRVASSSQHSSEVTSCAARRCTT
jgi:hypothetical protein